MNILLKSATIVDATSKNHLKKRDILIEKGIIKKIAASIPNPENIKELQLDNLHVSQGWFDSSVCLGEPGYEERETIKNGLDTAAKSGFTHIAVNSNTFPVTDSKSHVEFLKSKANKHATSLLPTAALTTKCKGVDLAELYDMKQEGAYSFYDYKQPIKNPNLLKLALQYTQSFNGLVQSFPLESQIAPKGIVNEEENSTRLGLKGIPALAEALQIARDLYILEYTGGKLHIPTISTSASVKLIKEAKKKGLQITCSVAINNLMLTDDALESFDTNYKLMPPLRTQKDVNALLKGIKDGTIDGVTSDHDPIDIENKKTEFDHAMYGSIGLESAFGALNKVIGTEAAIVALTNLKSTFDISESSITEGNKACLSLFNPSKEWTFNTQNILSTSQNAALLGQKLKGKVYGVFNNKRLVVN
ncbi:dihydroorotase [Patiriisocius hiemis]|uniref:Dihydroorotase n=1 Tax=Patiriisocius hiemis TaxID=3075604 RepID=A0ABU2Y9R4_9FLAO|nr:dihydroorotase [Constantimarinum sp. W242]MDT0554929.1 dihydroorotase [Constantimarinum sp. W242]